MLINSILLKAILSNNRFCCLCLKIFDGDENPNHFEDEVFLSSENNESIIDILSYVLDKNFVNELSEIGTVCQECMDMAIRSYKFIKMCKETSQNLNAAINNLNDCISYTKTDTSDYQTMFISFKSNDLTCKEYYVTNNVPTCPAAYELFDSIIQNEYINSFIEMDTSYFYDDNDINIQEERMLKKKRKKYNKDTIKTCDMLYDKNNKADFKCKICLKFFPKACNLRQHFIRVHAPKDFKCTECPRSFGSANILKQHKYESHCTVICSECGKTFYNRHTLKMHEISHKLRLVCPDCGRVYRRRITFNKHLELKICGQPGRKSHTEAKYMCDHCGKKYSNKPSLRVHIQFEHGNGKAHVCSWCNKRFHAQSILRAHILKHTQEKNFPCEICGGKFVTKESLLYHTRTHTGEKPYKCEFCESRFLSASRRVEHVKRHHTLAFLECDICHSTFKAGSGLRKHRERHFNPSSRLHTARLISDPEV